jgi:hypothetical protein
MGTRYDNNALVGQHAQGDAETVLGTKSRFDHDGNGSIPTFCRVVILDVISDPSIIDAAKLSYWEHELGVSNIAYASVAPRNSIIAKRVMGNATSASERTLVLYPFFPPHIAMPAKPGEHVWAIFENPDAKSSDIGYWMCRIVGPNFVEDVNYTHADRQFDKSFKPGTKDAHEGTDDPKYEFPNGVVDEKDGQRFTIGQTVSIHGDEKEYERLLKDTDAAKMSKYESVPRYRKRPADLAYEGSNNTLIVLGTDRTGPVANFDDDPEKGKIPKPVPDDTQTAAGMIDIVVGRGQTKDTAGKAVKNVLENKELGKSKKELSDKEGDPDLRHDRSRVMLSQRTKPDKNLKIDVVVEAHSKKEKIKDSDKGHGAVVSKSDKIRLIARQDVVILVTGADDGDRDEEGNLKDPDIDPDKCASVIVRTNGDIIFTPAKKGILKLGGDDADLAVLCTRVNNKGAGGKVMASPIVDTMAGAQGAADGLNGIFSTKVLLK